MFPPPPCPGVLPEVGAAQHLRSGGGGRQPPRVHHHLVSQRGGAGHGLRHVQAEHEMRKERLPFMSGSVSPVKKLHDDDSPSFPGRRRHQEGPAVQQVRVVLRRTDRLPLSRQPALPSSRPPAARVGGVAYLLPHLQGHVPVFARTELSAFLTDSCHFVLFFYYLQNKQCLQFLFHLLCVIMCFSIYM